MSSTSLRWALLGASDIAAAFTRSYGNTPRSIVAKKLGIEFPIFAFTHCRDVVVAVSKAGGLGVLGAVGFTPEQLEIELDWIDEHLSNPACCVVLTDGYTPFGDERAYPTLWAINNDTAAPWGETVCVA